MIDPFTLPTWLQLVLISVVLLGVALAWFTTGWGALLVIGAGILFAVYFRIKNSN